MSDKFQPLTTEQLARWILDELEGSNSIFGIPRALFFQPRPDDPFRASVYGKTLETPFGVAAGPHSQMAQNIIIAWLCGARFIELKTVQTLDELDISKPCIDMQDEGYNCEWSQELKVHESFEEYLRAWILIHLLHHKLGLPGKEPGIVFNMSVGYNLEGLQKPNMQWYLEKMHDAGEDLARDLDIVARRDPAVRSLHIPARMSDNVTLSTMHGCPPGEIEQISKYLLETWGLHTSVKCNPTLIGPADLRRILNQDLGFRDVTVPDIAFEHDLKYADAVPMLRRLGETARARNLQFGVKLSNTLEVENWRPVFPAKEKMMYMSGRALHAVTTNLAAKLGREFGGKLMMSFSAGADAFNVADLLAAGMRTITVCSDILKSGGYLRIVQYLDHVRDAVRDAGAKDIAGLIAKKSGGAAGEAGALANLERYAAAVLKDPRYRKDRFDTSRTKTVRELDLFDCIEAPCTDECPINQKVPQYMTLVREGRVDEAVEITRLDNPLPSVLGRACNHLCENTCIRTHYDDPLAIREMKRFIMDHEVKPHYRPQAPARDIRVAVVGGGPMGLSTAYFLGQAGYRVTVFEARPYVGGMVSGTIPAYRATDKVIEQDLNVIRKLGVEFRFGQEAGRDFTLADLRKQGYRYIALGVGAQKGKTLGVEGETSAGVLDALQFLRDAREGHPPPLGKRIGVIGGGDVAMDCARSAWRLTGAKVTIVYRRTIAEMPAAPEEIAGVIEEGIEIMELVKPLRVIAKDGKMTALEVRRMKLGDKDESGRRRPVDIPGSDFQLPLDNLIVAISQEPALKFLEGEPVERNKSGYLKVDRVTMETSVPGLYAGGDVVGDGPESIVMAMGDGRKIAEAIRRKEETIEERRAAWPAVNETDLIRRKARREYRVHLPHRDPSDRFNFEEVQLTLSEEEAKREASRCLDCHTYCSICVSVCPNRAILTYKVKAFERRLADLTARGGQGVASPGTTVRVDQPFQVAVLTDFCNECGNCETFCPTAGAPYKQKPRLYLRRKEFDAEQDNAFMIFRSNGHMGIRGRKAGQTHELVTAGEELRYTTPGWRVKLGSDFSVREASAAGAADGDVLGLDFCAKMAVLLDGLTTSQPALPVAN
ncbi:MAG: putative selenate reductase subunit YgfK [Kiritimatiellae bacterium]|nr:putative selenate reductase subunit YgfK [Kiritimatiellia bacterium]